MSECTKIDRAARHLDELYDSVEALITLIGPKSRNREWDMVSHLGLQMKTYRNLRRQNEAINLLLELLVNSTDEIEKASIASFLARTLEYLTGSETEIRRVIAAIFERSIILGEQASPAIDDLARCCEAALERRAFVHDAIKLLLVAEFKGKGSKTNPPIVEMLSDEPFRIETSETMRITRLPEELTSKARAELQTFVTTRMDQDVFFAVKAWEWYGLINRSVVSKFGCVPYYYSDVINREIRSFDGFSILALVAVEEFRIHVVNTPISERRALDALSLFGLFGFSNAPYVKPESDLLGIRSSIPVDMWAMIVRNLTFNPNALVGALFCMMFALEMESSEVWDMEVKKTARWVLKQDAVKRLAIFPKLKVPAESGSVFFPEGSVGTEEQSA